MLKNHCSTECFSGVEGALLDNVSDQIGAYMYEDIKNIGICRAGSASTGCRKRHNEHIRASKQNNSDDIKSHFYTSFPDKNSINNKKGLIRNF